MKYNPHIHHRRSIRLQTYDYCQPGAYFVTICTQHRECFLGEVIDGEMQFTIRGIIAGESWFHLPEHFPHVELDEFVVMPNHIHGIVLLIENFPGGDKGAVSAPLRGQHKQTLGKIVAYYKYQTTKIINQIDGTPRNRIWQRNYYERIIRNTQELENTQQYIITNPQHWTTDKQNPDPPP